MAGKDVDKRRFISMKTIKCALALLLCLGLLLGNCGALAESFSARQVAWCDE